MIDRIRRLVLIAAPIAAVASVTVSSAIDSSTQDCDQCCDQKKAPAGVTPDYETQCYPNTGLPPLLKRDDCLACLMDLCGNDCGTDEAPERCGTP